MRGFAAAALPPREVSAIQEDEICSGRRIDIRNARTRHPWWRWIVGGWHSRVVVPSTVVGMARKGSGDD